MKQIYVESYFESGYSGLMQYVNNVLGHPQREVIERRIKIMEFCDEFGTDATNKAFGLSRSTIYLWKQKLKEADGRLSSLALGDRTPKKKRFRVVHPFIERFIIEFRRVHPGADKTTITPALIVGCANQGVKPVSESTVGRIIHDLKTKGKLPTSNKVTINGRTGKLTVRELKPKKKLRRKDFVPRLPGDLVQMDTVSIFTVGLRRYIFTAIDVSSRFAFAYAYKANSSANGHDFIGKFLKVAPFAVRRVQTDNGSEFSSHFDDYCQKSGLTHFFNYPRHPQANACLERFNRTIQEQCVNLYLDYIDHLQDFNAKLMDYLVWYNTEKPHRGIGNVPPMKYYLDRFLSPDQSNMLWTLTGYCIL